MPQFDVDGARKAGYSDDEIIQHLTKSRSFDVEGAKKAGYSPAEIIQHLGSRPSVFTPEGAPGIKPPQVNMQPISDEQSAMMDVKDGLSRVANAVAGPNTAIGQTVTRALVEMAGGDQAKQLFRTAGQQQRAARTEAVLKANNPVGQIFASLSSVPFVDVAALGLEDLVPGPQSNPVTQGARGAVQAVAQAAGALTDPSMLVTGGAMRFANRPTQSAVSAAFAGDMASHAQQKGAELVDAVNSGDPQRIGAAVADAGVTAALGGAAGAHAIRGAMPPPMTSRVRPMTPAERAREAEMDATQRMSNEELLARETELAASSPERKSQQPQELRDIRQEISQRQRTQGAAGPQIEAGPRENRARRRARASVPEEGPSIEEQRIEAARGPIAERLGLDLTTASPEELATVDQLAREGWTGATQETRFGEPRKDAAQPRPEVLETEAVAKPETLERAEPAEPTPASPDQISAPASPQPTAREPKTLPIYGRNTEVLIPGERKRYTATYSLREAEDVIPSHSGQSFEPRPEYQFKNDRNYSEPQNAERIIKQAAEFDPAFVVNDNPTAEQGPPIIDWNGNVLGGNSRTMTLERVRRSNPEAYTAYRERIRTEAKRLGLDPAAVDKMKKPVLVRQIVDEVADPQAAITDFNKVGTAELRQAERAIADSRRVSAKSLEDITRRIEEQGPDGTLAKALEGDATDLVNRLTDDGVLTLAERPRMMDGQGRLTAEGKQRMTRLLTGRLFEDARQFEDTAPELRQKLERVVAPLAKVEGVEGWDITDAVKEGVRLVEEARGRDLSIDELTAQRGMFGDRNYTPEAIAIAKKLQQKPTEVAKAFRQYAAESEMGAGGQMMMGMEPPTPAESFREAFRTVDQLKADIKAQLTDERGSISGRRATRRSLAQNLTELAGIYLQEGIDRFSAFAKRVKTEVGDVASRFLLKAWNEAKALNNRLGRGEPERGSIRIERGQPKEEARLRSTATGSGGRGGRTTETATAAGAAPESRGAGGQPSKNFEQLNGGRREIITSPNLKESRENFIRKIGLDPETQKQVNQSLGEWEKANPERKVMTFEEVRREAIDLDPTLLKEMDKEAAQDIVTRDPAMRHAARNAMNAISREISSLGEKLRDEKVIGQERQNATRKLEDLERDFRKLADVIIPTRSQIGRMLAFERLMAEQTFDVTVWLDRARRATKLNEKDSLPDKVIDDLKTLTERGRKAEEAALDKLQPDQKAAEAKAMREAKREVEQEMGPEPAPPRTRRKPRQQQEAQLTPEESDLEARRERYKQQILKRFEQKIKVLTGEAKPKPKSKWDLPPEERRKIEQDPQVRVAKRALARYMQDLHKDNWWDFVRSARSAGLLSAPATHARNVTSNAAFQLFNEASRPASMVADFLIGQTQKGNRERTVQGMSLKALAKASREGATKGLEEARQIMKTGEVPDEGTTLWDFTKELNAKHLFEGRAGLKHLAWTNDAINLVFRSLKAEDRLFKRYAFRRSLEEQMATAKVKVPTEDMMLQAWEDADFMTFNNRNKAADMLNATIGRLRQQGLGGKVGAAALEFFLPFRNTPANVWMRGFEGMGGGFITGFAKMMAAEGKLTRAQQRAIAMEIGRAATGTTIVMLGMMAYKQGWATGMYNERERGEKAVAQAAGKPAGAIRVGDQWVSVLGLSPVANLFNVGATLSRKYGEWGDFFSNPDEALSLFSATVKEQPMLRGLQDLLEFFEGGNRGPGLAANAAGSFVPSILNQAGQMTDSVMRETTGGTLPERVGKAVAGRVPGARQQLDARLDAVGRPVKQDKLGAFFGFPMTQADDRPALQEMMRVGVSLTPQKQRQGETERAFEARQRIARDRGELPPERLPDEPRQAFEIRARATGEAILRRVEEIMRSDEYRRGTVDEQKLSIEGAAKRIRAAASREARKPEYQQLPFERREDYLLRRLR